jgi:hypothetical protein
VMDEIEYEYIKKRIAKNIGLIWRRRLGEGI